MKQPNGFFSIMKVRVKSAKFDDHFFAKAEADYYIEVSQTPLVLFDTIKYDGSIDSLTEVKPDGSSCPYFFMYDDAGNQHNIKDLCCKTVDELLLKASVLGCTME